MHASPTFIIVNLITLILSVCVHEFGHAFVADRFGDRLPRSQGRVTLNPLAHADPIGTIVLPLFFMVSTGSLGFGWGRPVYHNINRRDRRLYISAAGPVMNLLFALVISLILFTLYRLDVVNDTNPLYTAITFAIIMNFCLAIFNLVPIRPLDGGSVLAGLLPARVVPAYEQVQRYGIFVLFAIFLIPELSQAVLTPAGWLFRGLVNNLLGLPFPQVPLQ
jgi:Zn-dependent protease